ncbi:NAD(P)/FAD-dependent oxidoreductase [Microbulbifer sp. VTAC004]|uniref:NAD(P)/FAD-dependent oxidoreductase n=1 Tax=Microbulbifer sp. VTAC004 TaxID=3243386 RepID=UPI00403A363F
MDTADCIVIGAGALGLASANALARSGRRVIVLEQHNAIGTGISARSSEVIHAGIYYPTNSLKARACVEGKSRLYRFCEQYAVAHKRIGKLIVATSEDQLPQLHALKVQGDANNAGGLQILTAKDVRKLEPDLECCAAIYSPTTGIFDSHALLLALQGALEDQGGQLALSTRVTNLSFTGHDYLLTMEDGYQLKTPRLVVAAGLHTNKLLSGIDETTLRAIPPLYMAKGSYFTLSGKAPFSHLIYPLPEQGGLGIHLTLDLAGHARFGPDVEWVNAIDYSIDAKRGEKFYRNIRRYWPGLPSGSLHADYAGIRPKLVPKGAPAGDFYIYQKGQASNLQLLAFFGIESPGLTSALYLGELAALAMGKYLSRE